MTDKNALRLIAGKKGWIISDGKAGNDAQTRGVFDALGLDYEMKIVAPRGLWKLLSPYGPVNPAERFGSEASPFRPPWPDVAIAIGRLTTPYIRALKRRAGDATFTVILQNPKTGTGSADLFWVPDHDRLRGKNVITTLTAPHSFSARRLREMKDRAPAFLAALPSPRVAVLLGGPNGDYVYSPEAVLRLVSALKSLSALGAGLMITPSRRTPPDVTDAIREAVAGAPSYFWDGGGENPYAAILACADAFIAPADSVNMTGEPCATGCPVYVYSPDGGSTKFTRFHEALQAHGATRPCPDHFDRLESWSYEPLNSAEFIAGEIASRWVAWQKPGLAANAADVAPAGA
jgi:mitochondrial fission protein ELM1